jgi:hypothetical protein
MGLKKEARLRRIREHQDAIRHLSRQLSREDLQGLGLRRRESVSGNGALAERLFREQAEIAGWRASKRGWPDFILRKGDVVHFVETKSLPEIPLKDEQRQIAEMLAASGFRVFRWDPKDGFKQIGGGSAVPPWTDRDLIVDPDDYPYELDDFNFDCAREAGFGSVRGRD